MSGLGSALGFIAGTWLFTTNTAPTRPSAWYVALFDNTDTELSGNGYARKPIVLASAGNNNIFKNTAKVTFGPVTTADWAQATKFRVFSALTDGTAYSNIETLSSPRTGQVGDTISFNVDEFVVTL